MQLNPTSRRDARRANVSIEFALIAVLFLLPLIAGAADLICVINGQAQLNTSLQAMLYYAWSNPSAAQANTAGATTTAEAAIINAINNAPSTFHVTLNPGTTAGTYSNLLYYCLNTSGTPYTITANASATCATGTAQTFVQFSVSTSISLPIPLPVRWANPFQLTATGSAQVK